MLSVKIHKSGGDTLVACCDKEILGQTFTDGELDIHISERFYGGEHLSSEEFIKILEQATIANIIGEKSVKAAVEAGLVDESSVASVCGLKHVQIFSI